MKQVEVYQQSDMFFSNSNNLSPDVILEVFMFLFEQLNDDWQFETMNQCSLVCKEWNLLLNPSSSEQANISSNYNLWKALNLKYNNTPEHNDVHDDHDLRVVLSLNYIRNINLKISKIIKVAGINGIQYETSGKIVCFKDQSSPKKENLMGLVKRMINRDLNVKEQFEKKFLITDRYKNDDGTRCESIKYNSNIMERFEIELETVKNIHEEVYLLSTSFDISKYSARNAIMSSLGAAIMGKTHSKQTFFKSANEFNKLLKDECLIIGEHLKEGISVNSSLFTISFYFITKSGSHFHFLYYAERQ